jgi:hypothetical protein
MYPNFIFLHLFPLLFYCSIGCVFDCRCLVHAGLLPVVESSILNIDHHLTDGGNLHMVESNMIRNLPVITVLHNITVRYILVCYKTVLSGNKGSGIDRFISFAFLCDGNFRIPVICRLGAGSVNVFGSCDIREVKTM